MTATQHTPAAQRPSSAARTAVIGPRVELDAAALRRVGQLLDTLDLDAVRGNDDAAQLAAFVHAALQVVAAGRAVLATPIAEAFTGEQAKELITAHRPLLDAVTEFDRLIAL